jgi:hypothetical protein
VPPSSPDADAASHGGVMTDSDLDFLFDQVQRLAAELAKADASGEMTSAWTDWQQQRAIRGLPEVESDVLDALLQGAGASLLIAPAHGETQYKFRYHVRGGMWRTETPLSPARATRGETSPVARWVDDVGLIEELANSLPISFSELQGRYCVIPQTPAWDVVERAMRNLRSSLRDDKAPSGGDAPHADENALVVAQFRELLNRNFDRIAQAMWCSAVIGVAVREEGFAPLRRGLAELAKARGFERASENSVGLALEDVAMQIEARFGIKQDARLVGAPVSSADASRILAFSFAVSAGPIEDVEGKAWDDAHSRIHRWLQRGEAVPAELDELIAGAAGKGPGAVLRHYDWSLMTAADWLEVLVKLRTGDVGGSNQIVPTVLGPLVLRALGVRAIPIGLAVSAFPKTPRELVTPPVVPPAWSALFAGNTARHRVIVIRRSNSPRLAAMPLMQDTEAWVATISQLKRLLDQGNGYGPLLSGGVLPPIHTIVAVEMDPESNQSLEEEIYPALRSFGADVVYLYSEDRGREMRQPALLEPPTMERIVEAAVGTPTML